MSPERRAQSEAKAREMLANMPLDELRTARHLTQEHLASVLGIKQASISKMERRADMYVGSLRSSSKPWAAHSKSAPFFRTAPCASPSSPPNRSKSGSAPGRPIGETHAQQVLHSRARFRFELWSAAPISRSAANRIVRNRACRAAVSG